MILVLFFCIVILLIIVIMFSYIKINCNSLYISNIPEFKYYFSINIGLYVFGKIKILGFTLTKEKLQQSKIMRKLKYKLEKDNVDFKLNSKDIKLIKKSDINLEKIDTKIKIGTEDVILTSAIVGILASVIGIVLGRIISNYEEEKYKYVILPYYTQKNIFEMELNGIISVKLVHIIYVIYMFSKKRSENKYERTSNRRPYDYSYE